MRLEPIFLIFLVISSCGLKKEKASQKEESIKLEYLQKGGEIVSLSQSELLKNVSNAMKAGGPEHAIDFCNLHALSLKDSLSNLNNCEIRRIAIKYRNKEDMARTKMEKDQLDNYQIAHQNGEAVKPEVYLFDDRIEYYHPILINNGACLICHGNPGEQISYQTLEKINAYYPNDLATGFAMDDFRGSWKLTFLK